MGQVGAVPKDHPLRAANRPLGGFGDAGLLMGASPEGLAREGGQLGIGGEQHQTVQFGLGSQQAIKRIAMGLAVPAGPQPMGQGDRQRLEAIGPQQSW